jgi:hypothetical protein
MLIKKHTEHTFNSACTVLSFLSLYYSGRLAALTGKRMPIVGIRLHPEFPYIEAEVRYAVKEYAATAIDIVARRLRLGNTVGSC